MDVAPASPYLEGKMLLVNKPIRWTSFDVVNKIRYQLKRKLGVKKIKVGHAGTLDPLATGLLIVCTGKMTKQIDTVQALVKEYTGTITLGATTPSYDLESEFDTTFDFSRIKNDEIYKVALSFIGEQQQVPPAFSAKKVDGTTAYLKARRGEKVELKANNVTIYEFEITSINLPEINFRIVCSKGTYIRSIAHDFGKKLNNGGHLSALCRTKIGEFSVANAYEIDDFIIELVGEE